MASALFDELKSRFSLDGVDIDNWSFKFFSRVSVGIFMMASAASIAGQHFGDAIKCHNGDSYDEAYCWLHGTSHLPANQISAEINGGDNCFRYEAPNIGDGNEKDTKFYIWVSLMLFVSGALFIIPDQLWKHFEGGMMEQFGSNSREFLEDPEKSAKIFKDLSKNQTRRYFYTFVFFECLNYVVAIGNFVLIDNFLSGQFFTYGRDAMQYYAGYGADTTVDDGKETRQIKLNPLCSVFPTIVSCAFSTFGVTGKEDKTSKICILGQNLMNQQIYLLVWIWFIVLISASTFMILYRLVTFSLVDFQRRAIQYYIKSEDDNASKAILLDFDHIGNWFILTQIGRNSTPYTFRRFLDKVAGTTRIIDEAKQKKQKKKPKNTIHENEATSEENKKKETKKNIDENDKSDVGQSRKSFDQNLISLADQKRKGNDVEMSLMETN